ncbi:RimK family alpha-L-glutamate ligase [Rhodospirillaceae bacterium SYSU D60014]|uniref:ATP-grasp domain-containing protein n=1 Tax=Virgifigura deserti TaxID=2268457 RepID=UPI000E663FAA
MAQRTRIAIFTDGGDWHAGRLRRAFAALGADPLCLSLADCRFEIGTGAGGLFLPGFEDGLPSGAFIRTIPGGSFEQVTLRLGLLHALTATGVAVYNDARAVERCVDKSMTSFLLDRAGVPTPPTWTAETAEGARAVVRSEARPGRPLVLKPLFGSQGRGLRLVEDEAALPPPEEVEGVYYLQHFVTGLTEGWRDWRVFVVGGRAVAAMIRHGTSWRTNACRGARCEGVTPTGELAALAVAAAHAVGAGYAGVDVIRDARGRHLVLEVNSMPAWKALQKVSAVDIARALAEDLLAQLPEVTPLRTAARPASVVAGG